MTALHRDRLPAALKTEGQTTGHTSEYWRIRLLCRRPVRSLAFGLLMALLLALTPWQSASVFATTPASYDTHTGSGALAAENGGDNNTADGYIALSSNTTGANNIAVGDSALFANISGSRNTVTGSGALTASTSGNDNTAVGYTTLHNATADHNTAVGSEALTSDTTGSDNTAMGRWALWTNSAGNYNTATGELALYVNTSGTQNVADGNGALGNNTEGSYNTADGYSALYSNTQGSYNTALGLNAGYPADYHNSNVTGSYNTFVGYASGPSTAAQLTNATALGANALVGASNALVLGGTGANAVNVGIGTTTPNSLVQVGTASKKYGSYLQLPLVSSTFPPPPGQCNTTNFVGREVTQYNPNSKVATHWLCAPTLKWLAVH